MKLCIIPARGGSKRIPNKNIREFHGKPLIAWSIKAATDSGCFDHIVVSTDSDRVAEIAIRHGAEVPFKRPENLADDFTPTRPVINHAIEEITKRYELPTHVCCLYPTAPFVTSNDLIFALNQLEKNKLDFVFSCTSYAYPIQRAFRILSTGSPVRLYPKHRNTRSQDLEEIYHDAGQFYWGHSEAFLSGKDSISENSLAYIMPRYRVLDIDTQEDWNFATAMFTALQISNREL